MPQIQVDFTPKDPNGAAQPFQKIETTPEMFGAGIGAATQRLGQGMQDLAVKIADEQNQATANEAIVKHDIESGELINKFSMLQGQDRVNAYPDFVKNLTATRDKYKEGMSSDARKIFDNGTMRQFGYQVVNASREAATAARQYASAAASARLDSSLTSSAHQNDDDQFAQSVAPDELRKMIVADPKYAGSAPEVVDQVVREKEQEAWQSRVQALAYREPERAYKLLKEKSDKIDPTKMAALENHVTNTLITRRSIDIAGQVTGATYGDLNTPEGRAVDATAKLSKVVGKIGAAGVVGNWLGAENIKMQPDPNHPDGVNKGDGADGSDSIGYAQWNQDRAQGLRKLMRDNPALSAHDANVQWAAQELGPGGKYAHVGERLRNASSPEEAAKIVQDLYEVPADKTATLAQRQAAAAKLAQADIAERPVGARGPGFREAAETQAVDLATKQATALGLSKDQTTAFTERALTATRAKYGQAQADYRDNIAGAQLTVQDALYGDPDNPPKDMAALQDRLGAEGMTAFNNMPKKYQDAVQRQLLRNSNNQPLTPERIDRYNEIVGRLNDPETRPAAMADQASILDEDLPLSMKNKLQAMVKGYQKDMTKQAPTTAAMAQLEREGMFRDTPVKKVRGGQNKEWNQFEGTLQAALEEEQKTKGTPSPERITQIGKEVLRQIVTRKATWFGMGPEKNTIEPAAADKYEATVTGQGRRALDMGIPEDDRNFILDQAKKSGRMLNAGDIYRVYYGKNYRGLRQQIETAPPPQIPSVNAGAPNNG